MIVHSMPKPFSWTPEAIQAACELYETHTAGETAEILSRRWGAAITKNAINNIALPGRRKSPAAPSEPRDTLPEIAPAEAFDFPEEEEEETPEPVARQGNEPSIDEIVRHTCRQPRTTSWLCLRLVCSEADLMAAIVRGASAGYRVAVHDGIVTSKVAVGPYKTLYFGEAFPKERQVIAHISDMHFGSRHCLEDALLECMHLQWERGCRFGICTGDILDGNTPVLLPDQDHIGFDNQAERAVRIFKKAPPIQWAVIDGNHDGYFSASSGFVAGELLQAKMREANVKWHFAGVCQGRAVIQGAKVFLWHPQGGASSRNAVRRVLNEKVEALEEPCDILALAAGLPERVFAIAGGTFQSKNSEFANRITKPWDVGGGTISFDVDELGQVHDISARQLGVKPW